MLLGAGTFVQVSLSLKCIKCVFVSFTYANSRLHQLSVLLQVDCKRVRAIYRRRALVPLYLQVNNLRQFSFEVDRELPRIGDVYASAVDTYTKSNRSTRELASEYSCLVITIDTVYTWYSSGVLM